MPAITIVAVGSRGDVQPYLALGAGLAAAGADVTIATHVGFAEAVAEVGVGFASVPGDPVEILRSPEGDAWQSSGRSPLSIARGLVDLARPLADAFLEASVEAVRGADLVLFSTLGVAAHHAAEAQGIPVVGAWLQPLTRTGQLPHLLAGGLPRPFWRASHTLADQVAWRFVAGQDRRWRTSLGLEPYGPAGPFHLVEEGRLPVLYGVSRALVPPPSDWPRSVRVTGAWFLPGGGLGPDVESFLADGPPPVVVGFGSRQSDDPGAVGQAAVSAARAVGVRLVLLSGWGGAVADGGGDVFVVPEAPHDALLPRSAGFVHHGGAGATHAGIRAGIPSFVAPSFADQFFWARRVAEIGAGDRLGSVDEAGFALAFSRMVHQPWPGARRAAAIVADEDGVATATSLVRTMVD